MIDKRICQGCGKRYTVKRVGGWRTRRFCGQSCWMKHRHATTHYRIGWVKPGLDPTERPTVRDIEWVAGVYEGEGSCGHARGSSGGTTHATVGQTDKTEWLVRRLQALFGGSVYRSSRKRGNPNFDARSWHIHGARARGFLMTIYFRLSPRRQAQLRKALAA